MFAGGGDERDSRPLDEIFRGWVSSGTLLYLPTALVQPASQKAGYRWIKDTFAPLGLTNIEVWLDLAGKTADDLNRYDAVYIGGGNTFYLLQQIRLEGLDQALVQFALSGKPVYGGSAGAIILSHDITACVHIDPNIVGLTDYTGLDLALGYNVWCHYTEDDADRVEAYVRETGIPSIAVSEKSGVYRLGNHLYAAGSEPAIRFTPRGHKVFAPGEQMD
jgi:dipeptidase E